MLKSYTFKNFFKKNFAGRTVGGVRHVRHSPWIPSKSRTSVPPPVEKQLIEEGNSSSQGTQNKISRHLTLIVAIACT